MVMLNEGKVFPNLIEKGEKTLEQPVEWYLDNGASNHMMGTYSMFHVLDEKIHGMVKFGDGSTV